MIRLDSWMSGGLFVEAVWFFSKGEFIFGTVALLVSAVFLWCSYEKDQRGFK